MPATSVAANPSAPLPTPSPVLTALASWLVPGAGYWLLGDRVRGGVAGVTILLVFVAGLLIGGIRVMDVPGVDRDGSMRLNTAAPHAALLRTNFVAEILNKPWSIGQVFAGPVAVAAGWGSVAAAESGVQQSTARVFDIGTLYTAVAGMLNLLVIIDASHRAANRQAKAG